MVQVRYSEGVAIHTGPESCAGHCRQAVREALTGGRIGQVLGFTHYFATRKDGVGRAQDTEKANESQAPGDQGDAATAQAYADRRAGTVAWSHDEGPFRLLRGANQHLPAVGLPLSHQHSLVPKSAATQPAAPADVGTDGPTYRAIPTVTARSAPVAKPSVHRQSLEVGAECVSSARSDLCGGWSAMAIPTAIKISPSGC